MHPEVAVALAAAVIAAPLPRARAPAATMHCAAFTLPPQDALRFTYSADEAAALQDAWQCDNKTALLQDLTQIATALHGPTGKPSRFAPISDYRVAMAMEGASGAVYLGVNLEFPNSSLHNTVHGEQMASINAILHQESGVRMLVSAGDGSPCGHCRQFLNEFTGASQLQITGAQPGSHMRSLAMLFPSAFGPDNLGNKCPLLRVGGKCNASGVPQEQRYGDLVLFAQAAARACYNPYTGTRSGVALRVTGTARIALGWLIENAAFDQTVDPLQVALIDMLQSGTFDYSAIREAVIAEAPGGKTSYVEQTKALLAVLAPNASLLHVIV